MMPGVMRSARLMLRRLAKLARSFKRDQSGRVIVRFYWMPLVVSLVLSLLLTIILNIVF